MADTNQQSIWLDLESRFRQIQDTYIRADWHRNKTQSGVWENWSVTGTSNILGSGYPLYSSCPDGGTIALIYQLLVGRQMPIGCLGAVCFTANLWLKRQNHPESPAKSTGTNAGSRPDMSVRITRVKWITRILGIRRFEALASLASWEELVAKEWQITRWAAKLPLSMAQLHQKRRFPFQLQGYGFGKER